MNGLLLVDKPAGPTSHDVVARARQAFKESKLGHAGTLDPQATGLLVLALGDATRWLPYLPTDKRYLATARFGLETDTEDIWGKPLRRCEAAALPGAEAIRGALQALRDETSQVPPMVSALKHEGKPLYAYAREGVEIERKARPMELFSLEVLAVNPPEAEFRVHCGSGTYVRSLCATAGKKLGSGACMSSLRRLSVGPFSLDGAVNYEAMESAELLGPDKALAHLKEYKVAPADEKFLSQGRALEMESGDYDAAQAWRLSALDGTLLGLGTPKRSEGGWKMQPSRVFARP